MGHFAGTWEHAPRADAKQAYARQPVWQFGGVRPYYKSAQDRAIAISAQVMLTVAAVLGLYVFWDLEWSSLQANSQQAHASQQLDAMWHDGDVLPSEDIDPGAVGEGEPIANMFIPAFGQDWKYTIVNGTGQDALMSGPGYYTGSQRFGQRGNAGIAGHRDGRGAPFHDLDALSTCDAIVVETATQWHIYNVLPVGEDYTPDADMSDVMRGCMDYRTSSQFSTPEYKGLAGRVITQPGDVDVLAPVPNKPYVSPEKSALSLLTLTTCHPLWSNAQRLVIHAALSESVMKSAHEPDWRPDVLTDHGKEV